MRKENFITDINKKELLHGKNGIKFGKGYRIVYYYNSYYKIGAFAKNIADFMVEFVEICPIEDDSDIPSFISNDDLLERYLKDLPEIEGVAIYRTDGTLILRKVREHDGKKNVGGFRL
ncbi:MAG: hypothetical protein ACLU3D_00065 [Acutalibacteraceae bacterium]|jgi:hypothetical protein